MFSKKPKMILFDVGGTLFDDGKCMPSKGFEELRLRAENSEITTSEKLEARWNEFMSETSGIKSESGVTLDIPLSAVLKYAAMKEGLKINLSITKQEEIFDRFNSTRKVIDGVPELLKTLKNSGIRTAVISNNMMSGESLSLAINRWIPESDFEFCLTSADILYTKPSKDIFECAINFAGVSAEECWYCGDGKFPDVNGSSGVSMKPILLDVISDVAFEYRTNEINKKYLAINNWSELIYLINEFDKNCFGKGN